MRRFGPHLPFSAPVIRFKELQRQATGHHALGTTSRSSSKKVRISWYQLLSVVYFSRGTLPQKGNGEKGHLAGGPRLKGTLPLRRSVATQPPLDLSVGLSTKVVSPEQQWMPSEMGQPMIKLSNPASLSILRSHLIRPKLQSPSAENHVLAKGHR